MKDNIPTTPLTVSGNDDTLFISGNAIHDADGEWPTIQATITTAIQTIQNVVTTVLAAVQEFWRQHGDEILTFAQTVWGAMMTTVRTFWDENGQQIMEAAQIVWICDCMNRQHADLIVTAVNSHDALVAACRLALIEMGRITGDIGFEPERFRERMAVVHALAAALAKAQEAAS